MIADTVDKSWRHKLKRFQNWTVRILDPSRLEVRTKIPVTGFEKKNDSGLVYT